MATIDVAKGLVELCKTGDFNGAMEKYYGEDIVSVEPMGEPAIAEGLDAVRAKAKGFFEYMDVHSCEVFGPYVNGDQFAVRFLLDATNKGSGERMMMDEVGVYTVKEDKVVHEVFMYGG
jgi:ketosteroid isomerase-like protein